MQARAVSEKAPVYWGQADYDIIPQACWDEICHRARADGVPEGSIVTPTLAERYYPKAQWLADTRADNERAFALSLWDFWP